MHTRYLYPRLGLYTFVKKRILRLHSTRPPRSLQNSPKNTQTLKTFSAKNQQIFYLNTNHGIILFHLWKESSLPMDQYTRSQNSNFARSENILMKTLKRVSFAPHLHQLAHLSSLSRRRMVAFAFAWIIEVSTPLLSRTD